MRSGTKCKEGRTKAAAFGEAAENLHFIILVNDPLHMIKFIPETDTLGMCESEGCSVLKFCVTRSTAFKGERIIMI